MCPFDGSPPPDSYYRLVPRPCPAQLPTRRYYRPAPRPCPAQLPTLTIGPCPAPALLSSGPGPRTGPSPSLPAPGSRPLRRSDQSPSLPCPLRPGLAHCPRLPWTSSAARVGWDEMGWGSVWLSLPPLRVGSDGIGTPRPVPADCYTVPDALIAVPPTVLRRAMSAIVTTNSPPGSQMKLAVSSDTNKCRTNESDWLQCVSSTILYLLISLIIRLCNGLMNAFSVS